MSNFTFNEKQLELSRHISDLERKTVIGIVKGSVSQRKAYYDAGGKAKTPNSADATVSRMLKKVKVNEFYHSLIEETAGNAILSRDEAMGILTEIARTKITDIAEFSTITILDEEGKPKKQSVWSFKDTDTINERGARIVSEVSVGKDGLKLKTHSQVDAIKQLRAMDGWDKTVEVDHKLTIVIEGKDAEL